MSLLVTFSLICIVLTFLVYLYKKKVSRMDGLTSNIPGPKGYPIIGSALEFGTEGSEILSTFVRFFKTYGSESGIYKYWIGPQLFIVMFSPDDIKEVLSNEKLVDKSFIYDYLKPSIGSNSLLTAKGDEWRKRRKIVAPTFNLKIIEMFLKSFNSNSKILVEKLKREMKKPGFDVYPYIDLCTMDIISETAIGVELEVQKKESCQELELIHQLENIFVYRITRLWTLSDTIFNMSPPGLRQKNLIKFKNEFIQKVMDSKQQKRQMQKKVHLNHTTQNNEDSVGEKKRQSFLDALLDYSENDDTKLSDQEISDEVATMISAGQSTTAVTIGFALYALMKHPDVQEKVVQELNEIFNGSDRDANANDINKMDFLEMVIKETLRMWTSVPLIGRSIQEDVQLKSGYTLPAGSNAMILFYALHHNPKVFPNPDNFDPKRFTKENSIGRHQYAFCPFSAGLRSCIGYKYAMAEMKVILSHLIRKYKILPMDNSPDIMLSNEIVLRSTTGVHIRIKNR